MRSIDAKPAGGRRRARRRPPEVATARIGSVLVIPAILRSLGADPAEVLAEVGLDLELFNDPENRISYAARSRLVGHCAARTGCRHFGLLIGQRSGLHTLGLVGLLVKYSPDVGTALRSLVRHFHLHLRGATVTLTVDGGRAMLSYEIYQSKVEDTQQTGDGSVAGFFNALRELCGPGWAPVELRFAHRRPDEVEPFSRFFRAQLRFDAEQYGVVFAADWLRRPLPATDPELRRLLQQQIDALEARHGDDFPARVRSVLRTALLTNQASADQIAALFSMHSRTLNRHLNDFGASFRELVDEGRFEIARQTLADSSMYVRQVADLLGYADASAFTRAFRRWSGTTPALWRSEHTSRAPRSRQAKKMAPGYGAKSS